MPVTRGSDEMGSPHYSLRWNNHQSHLLTAFDSLLQNETLVDVTLVCEETSFKAHKVVLSACSPYFQRIFSETPCKHPVIVLKDLRGWEVQAIVDFMYRGEISVGQEQLSSLIKAAESLQVRGLAHTERIPVCEKERGEGVRGERGGGCFSPGGGGGGSGGGLYSAQQPPAPPPGHCPPGPPYDPASLRLPQAPHLPHISFSEVADRHCSSPIPRRKQARPRRRSGETCGAQDLSKGPSSPSNRTSDTAENLSIKKSSNNPPNNTPTPPHLNAMKMESEDSDVADSGQIQPVELTTTPQEHRIEFSNSSEPLNLPPPPHDSPIENSFQHLASISSLPLTPPHMFSLDSHLGLFPGLENCRNPLLNDFPEPRLDNHHISTKKKMGRPKGQHSAPRGGPPRSWTNAELTEALQHVWNKKMTTSQASRIFGIPYNSLLMYVRGKYGKSLKLEQLKKECFGDLGGPLDLLGLGSLSNNNNPVSTGKGGQKLGPPEPDLMLGPPGFNPGPYPPPGPPNFYPDFGPPFPVPVGMVHLLPQSEKNREPVLPIDFAKEERNSSTPLDYGKESELKNSPVALDYVKEEHSVQNNCLDNDDPGDSPGSHREISVSQQQNGQD